MGEGHISRGELRPHPSTPIFCCSLQFLCTLWRRTTKFGMVTHGEGLVLRGSATPPPQGAGLQRCPIFGVPSYLCVLLCCRTIKFDVVTMGMSSIVVNPNFVGYLLFMCTQTKTTEFGVVTQMGRGVFRSVMPLHLHKCIAQFVSDS